MPGTDILSDVLKVVRLRGTAYFRAACRFLWGLEMTAGEFANFHIVNSGRCWLRVRDGADLIALEEGDAVMLPRGDAHALLCSPDANAHPAPHFLNSTGRPGDDGATVFGRSGDGTTTITCGHFDFDRSARHPLCDALDSLIHISGEDSRTAVWLHTVTTLAVQASANADAGTQTVIDRLAEALFAQMWLQHLNSLLDMKSYLAAIGDAEIGRTLVLMHAHPARDWTVAVLAREAGMSRSGFAARFNDLVGESPIFYLARWRLLKARELLSETSASVQQVSGQVGYMSEFAFSKAFKRPFGISPTEHRQAS
jgi:AraC family transcriptional regulator, activator of mtrCDE